PPGPRDGVLPCRPPSAVRVPLPAAAGPLRVDSCTLCVYGHDDALRAEALRRLPDELRVRDGCRVDAHLVGAGPEQVADIVERPDAATHRQWHEDLFGRTAHHVEEDLALLMRSQDLQVAKL